MEALCGVLSPGPVGSVLPERSGPIPFTEEGHAGPNYATLATDYLELKVLENEQVQEEHSNLPSFS